MPENTTSRQQCSICSQICIAPGVILQFQNTGKENILTSPSAKTMTAGMAGMAKLAAKSPQSSAITSRTLRLDFLLGPSLEASSISFSSLATSLQAPALSGYDEYYGGNTMYCMWRTGRDFDQRREPRKQINLTSWCGSWQGQSFPLEQQQADCWSHRSQWRGEPSFCLQS